jgi:hypothetical protein
MNASRKKTLKLGKETLKLSKETLKILDPRALAGIAGGGATGVFGSCPCQTGGGCHHTH